MVKSFVCGGEKVTTFIFTKNPPMQFDEYTYTGWTFKLGCLDKVLL